MTEERGSEMGDETSGREIDVKTANLQTAAISIRTLQVNDKQMTLAVFRQLVERDALDEIGRLTGQVWGWVNYHPDKCDGDKPHWHYIWQDGDMLVRGRAPRALHKLLEASTEFGVEEDSLRDVATLFAIAACRENRSSVKIEVTTRFAGEATLAVEYSGKRVHLVIPSRQDDEDVPAYRVLSSISRWYENAADTWAQNDTQRFFNKYRPIYHVDVSADGMTEHDALWSWVLDTAERLELIRRTADETLKTIEAAGQIFIAV